MEDLDYDFVIVGGGSAGVTAAGFAAQLGVRVALVEKHRIGGDCTWTGCVPSKALLKAAKVVHEMRSASQYGLPAYNAKVDLQQVMTRVHDAIDEVYQAESPEVLAEHSVDVYWDTAHFVDADSLTIGDRRLKARRVLLTTGASPFVPPITGLAGVDFLTYEDIWDLEVLPERFVAVGAGPIGCEMAQAFHRLGSQVTLIEALDRILPNEEPEVSQLVGQIFANEGIHLCLGMTVEQVWQDEAGIHLVSGENEVVGDALLIAIGRRPNVEGLGLEQAGIDYSAKGIAVNDNLQTSQRHVYAAGDCTGGFQFTHYAGWQAFMATRNALLPGAATGIAGRIPWATFTDPEVARVGLSEAQARDQYGSDFQVCEWPMNQVDRAITDHHANGFIKIIHKPDGTLLGTTIVADRAGEMIHEWAVAMEHDLKLGDIAKVIHVYPTYSMAAQQATAEIQLEKLLAGTSGRLIRGMTRLIR